MNAGAQQGSHLARRGVLLAASIAVLAAAVLAAPSVRAAAPMPCTEQSRAGGDWTTLNGDHANSRSQVAEGALSPAAGLEPAWSFSGEQVGIENGMRSTPVVAYGCVYLAFGLGYLGDRGDVVALDADTGELVWHVQLDASVLGLAVADGLVYATPSRGTRGEVAMPVVTDSYAPAGSFAVALDARTGARRWTSERLDDGNPANGTFINASPVAYRIGGRRLLFVPMAGGSGDGARVPMYFLDALTGRTVKRSLSLEEAEYDEGYGGTGIWSTAAFDPTAGHLYAGTSDSDGHSRQHAYNNALLKIDADPRRTTFGSVVGHYTGTTEHHDLDPVVGHPNNPQCGATRGVGVDPPTFFDTSSSVECLELDLDFGASPNLYAGDDGALRVGALQKSGLYHSVSAGSMGRVWRFQAGPGGAAMSSATAAVAGGAVHVGGTPNLLHAVSQHDGSRRWTTTTDADLFAYQPVTWAAGALYAITDTGALLGFDAATGTTLLRRDLAADGGFPQCLGVGAGVAVAHGLLFAPCDAGGPNDLAGLPGSGGGVVAYR